MKKFLAITLSTLAMSAALLAAPAAMAGGVHWSVNIGAVGYPAPVAYYPAPPQYYAPVVYSAPPVYAAAPVYYGPAYSYGYWHRYHGPYYGHYRR